MEWSHLQKLIIDEMSSNYNTSTSKFNMLVNKILNHVNVGYCFATNCSNAHNYIDLITSNHCWIVLYSNKFLQNTTNRGINYIIPKNTTDRTLTNNVLFPFNPFLFHLSLAKGRQLQRLVKSFIHDW